MDKLELNKLFASVLVASIIAMLAGYLSKSFYPKEHRSHHEEQKRGYAIEVLDEDTSAATGEGSAVKEAIIKLGMLMAAADASQGEASTKKCAVCHSFTKGGGNKVGPELWGVAGRNKASGGGYSYSEALSAMSGQKWTYEELFKFLRNPKKAAPGTKMAFAGIKSEKELVDLLAYLKTLGSTAPAVPANYEFVINY